MGQKAITIYTPATDEAHINAEDDAQLWRSLLGGSGITLADDKLSCTKLNDNTIRISSGQYSNQGYIVCVQGGTTIDLSVDSGTAGAYRHDLVVAHFTRGGGDTADTHEIEIVKGTDASTAGAAEDPTLEHDDLRSGGMERQEALYRLNIAGTTLQSIERVAPYIGPVYQ